jgi:hypothetical protein
MRNRNPGFGKWARDGDPMDGPEPDWGEVREPERRFPACWDLRSSSPRRAEPCRVVVGGWALEGVVFPARRETRDRVKALAEEALRARGRLRSPFAYPVPAQLGGRRRHLVGLYRYYLARALAGSPGGAAT